MATKKIYYENMYQKECDAFVNKIDTNGIILNQTVFFPEGGGQVGDTGFINDIRIIDAQKKISKETRTIFHKDFPIVQVDNDVLHLNENTGNSLSVGQKVKVKIDWERRYTIMRMHSACHVVHHYLFQEIKNLKLAGCYIKSDSSRFDFNKELGSEINTDILPTIENLSNKFIEQNIDIECLPLEGECEAFYWICGEIKIPCGGMHVANTSEIGSVKLRKKSQGKRIDRVYISLI